MSHVTVSCLLSSGYGAVKWLSLRLAYPDEEPGPCSHPQCPGHADRGAVCAEHVRCAR